MQLTDVRDIDCTFFFDFSHHMPQEVCALPHDTVHDVVPSFVIFQNLTSDVGSCLLFCTWASPHFVKVALAHQMFDPPTTKWLFRNPPRCRRNACSSLKVLVEPTTLLCSVQEADQRSLVRPTSPMPTTFFLRLPCPSFFRHQENFDELS